MKIIYKYFRFIMCKKTAETGRCRAMLLILVGSFMELLGVSVILPFIQAFMEPETLWGRWYVRMISSVFRSLCKEQIQQCSSEVTDGRDA